MNLTLLKTLSLLSALFIVPQLVWGAPEDCKKAVAGAAGQTSTVVEAAPVDPELQRLLSKTIEQPDTQNMSLAVVRNTPPAVIQREASALKLAADGSITVGKNTFRLTEQDRNAVAQFEAYLSDFSVSDQRKRDELVMGVNETRKKTLDVAAAASNEMLRRSLGNLKQTEEGNAVFKQISDFDTKMARFLPPASFEDPAKTMVGRMFQGLRKAIPGFAPVTVKRWLDGFRTGEDILNKNRTRVEAWITQQDERSGPDGFYQQQANFVAERVVELQNSLTYLLALVDIGEKVAAKMDSQGRQADAQGIRDHFVSKLRTTVFYTYKMVLQSQNSQYLYLTARQAALDILEMIRFELTLFEMSVSDGITIAQILADLQAGMNSVKMMRELGDAIRESNMRQMRTLVTDVQTFQTQGVDINKWIQLQVEMKAIHDYRLKMIRDRDVLIQQNIPKVQQIVEENAEILVELQKEVDQSEGVGQIAKSNSANPFNPAK